MMKQISAVVLGALALALSACAGTTSAPTPAPIARNETLPTKQDVLFWTPAEQEVGYRRIEDVFPTRTIARGATVHPLPRDRRHFDVSFDLRGETYDLERFMRDYRVSGLLVIKNGVILAERYGLGRTEADRWTSFSVAKSLTSTLVGAAIRDGSIKSINDPIENYITELRGSAYAGVTVRQLLTMSSGVRWNEDYTDPNSDVARAGFEPAEPGVNPLVSYLRKLPRAAPAGTKFNYSTGETDLAGILVSRATGKTLSDYASEKIWKPYGMERDAVWLLDSSGHERGGCCISMTLRDYGRVGQFILEGAPGAVADGWVAEATKKQIDIGDPNLGYGYFWWIGADAFDARGIFGQMIYIVPQENLVVVLNSAWSRATGADLGAARNALRMAIRERAKGF